ncbi:MAG: hypothetical protein KAU58_06780 [Candidatus Omnitrophica bacterium]|nr:hypothetical protein [Candidatus Omnitrophota bacterium]
MREKFRCLIVGLVVVCVFVPALSGCAGLRRKFVRKRTSKKTSPHYHRIEKYTVVPSIELYTKHYIYWRSWHREIIELLGENTKKDKRCIREMIGSLEDMKSMLVDKKEDMLDGHIQILKNIENDINKGALTLATRTRIRRTLEKEFKLIKINFSYRKMEPFIRSEFRR